MLVKTFSILIAGSLITAAGAAGYMLSDRGVPVVTISRVLLTDKVKPGADLEWRIKIYEKKRCFIHTDRIIYDAKDVRHILQPIEFQAGIGQPKTENEYTVKVPVPYDAAFGPARYVASTVYKCNLIHYIWPIYGPNIPPLKFEIVPL